MKKLFLSLFLVLVLVSQGVIAQKSTELSQKLPVNPNVKIGTLPNGLTYYIEYNKKPEKKVELRLAVNVGSILEDNDQLGLAHFMEHMNFNGLKHFPNNELVHYLQSIGVGFGNDLNAYTGFDETVYILPVPSDDPVKLDKAFTVIADWSGAALLAPDEIEKERGVILAESRMGKGADDRMMKKWLPAMFNGSKYGERLPIGKDSIIEGFKPSVLEQFYHDWYRPDLQAVMVVGDMPVAEAEKMIIEKFSDFKNPSEQRKRPATFDVKPFTKNQAMVLSDAEAERISISLSGSSHPRNPVTTVGDYRNRIVEGLCFSMLSARFEELKNTATPPFVYAYAYVGGGWARGYESYNGGAMCGINEIHNAVEALVVESMRVKKFGFTEAELTRAKASLLSDLEKQYNERDKTESGRLINELVSYFLEQDGIPGIVWEYNYVKDNISGISLKDFEAVRAKIDIDEKFFVLITAKTEPNLPTDEQLKNWVETALKQPVEPYKENKVAASLLDKEPVAGKIMRTEKNEKLGTTTYTLSNNVTVCIKPTDFKNDEVILKGSRHGGYSLYSGADYQSGQWCNNAVDEMGYGNFSNSDLNKFLSGKIASVMPIVDDYTEYISANSSIKDIETMFQLLYLKCTEPRKDEIAFQSYISRSKQQLESIKQNPQYLFMDSAYNTLYQGNVRAHLIESTSDYDKINIDHAIEFYKQRIGNAYGMYYNIVGSFTEAQIVPLIEKYIGGLKTSPIDTKIKDLGFYPKTGSNTFTLKKGSEAQAMLVHYITGKMPYNAEENFKLGQLNVIINNKIVDTIREKMSAIYGGGCGGSVQKYPREEFVIQSQFPCSPDNIEKVNTAFFELIESTKVTGGITETDLKNAREPAIERNKVNLKKNEYWLNNLQNSYLLGNDPERILTTEDRLKALTPEQLVEVARKFYSTPNVFKAVWLPEMVK
jgi:zinc protease